MSPKIRSALLLPLLLGLSACAGLFAGTTTIETVRGPRKAQLFGPDVFERLEFDGRTEAIADAGLADDERLLIVARGDARLAFRETDLAWRHLAEGTLGGEPFLVAY